MLICEFFVNGDFSCNINAFARHFLSKILKKERISHIIIEKSYYDWIFDMEFDLSKEVARIGTSWNDISYDLNKRNGTLERSFALHGPKGCGKTKFAQEFVRSHAYAFYISFGKLPKKEALSAFMKTYIPDVAGIDTFSPLICHHGLLNVFARRKATILFSKAWPTGIAI